MLEQQRHILPYFFARVNSKSCCLLQQQLARVLSCERNQNAHTHLPVFTWCCSTWGQRLSYRGFRFRVHSSASQRSACLGRTAANPYNSMSTHTYACVVRLKVQITGSLYRADLQVRYEACDFNYRILTHGSYNMHFVDTRGAYMTKCHIYYY